jgi:hypothetical protein
MPSDDTESSPGGMSRRSVIRGAAAAGAAGLAVSALGAAISPAASASTRSAASPSAASAGGEVKTAAGPIVVHVRNAKSGDIEIFSGASQTRVHDTDLAARIARAIG